MRDVDFMGMSDGELIEFVGFHFRGRVLMEGINE
jgi:hypothetical protein